ncbi:MAG: hypothetical protein KGK34_02145 [Chloroflexota bacterium]|nr:hypothetical protein [Chloroflexota bacterium]
MTLTVAWLKEAVRGLDAGTHAPGEVIAAIEADGRKLWTWPEFKELRGRKLADHCGECGARTDLVLQHLVQPDRPGKVRVEAERGYLRKLRVDLGREYHETPQPMLVAPAFEYFGCPGCGDRSYYGRRTKKPRFRCVNGQPPHAFEEPVLVQVPEREVHAETFKEFAMRRSAEHLAPYRDEIGRHVARSVVQQLIAYFAGHGVVTACKRCAFRYDAQRLEGHAPIEPMQPFA